MNDAAEPLRHDSVDDLVTALEGRIESAHHDLEAIMGTLVTEVCEYLDDFPSDRADLVIALTEMGPAPAGSSPGYGYEILLEFVERFSAITRSDPARA